MSTITTLSEAAGAADLDAAADELAARLIDPLKPLARIAYNYLWSWAPGATELFAGIEPTRWPLCGRNAVRLLHETPTRRLDRLATDAAFLTRMREVSAFMDRQLTRPDMETAVTAQRPAAFFCAEYAIHGSMPIYSGGLGVLAGDILKAASDMALPMVAVGIMYRHGYFRHRTDAGGWQHEYWVDTDPDLLPAALITGADGHPLTVTIPLTGRDAVAQVWRVSVGRVPLLLLDTYRPENRPSDRFITSRLYVGDPDIRLDQYAVLGIGGVRVLQALGIEPAVLHLNEGHAAFAAVELARRNLEQEGSTPEEALAAARERVVFTTHTPVPAGNDTYAASHVAGLLSGIAEQLGVGAEALIARGRTHPEDAAEPFGVTQFALRLSRSANGVARRHGEVARGMWQELYPGTPVEEVPITSVTNGVHIPTWLGPEMRSLLDRYLPGDWLERQDDPEVWTDFARIPDEELWAARQAQRAALIHRVAERSVMERLARGEGKDYVHAAADTLSADALTVGFARRLATYKRLGLLVADLERMLTLLRDEERPVQILIAGKAHPKDDEGKRLVTQLFEHRYHPEFARRVVFLDDYDLNLGAALTRGCDVWVNLPRPPLEASGTSGMKSALNGGLQVSVLDGWWPEAYDGANGWAISGEVDPDHQAQDARHADEFLRLVAEQVVPTFYDRADGLPRRWLEMVRRSVMTCAPRFSAQRMDREYATRIYAPDAG